MRPTQPVQVDENGTLAISGVLPGTYLATMNPDGSVILEPAQTLTNAQIAQLSQPNRASFTPTQREARRTIARALLQRNPDVTGSQVKDALKGEGFVVSLRTAYMDLAHAQVTTDQDQADTH